MAGVEPSTVFRLEQTLEVFGEPCRIVVDGGRVQQPGRVVIFWDTETGRRMTALADVHLPAAIQLAILNALYATYLTLPLAEIGRAIETRQAPGVHQVHRVHHARPLRDT